MITLNHPMIKELSLAVIFGLLIGFGLTGTFYYVKQSNSGQKRTPNIVVPTSAPENKNTDKVSPTSLPNKSGLNIEISSPQNNDIIPSSKTTLKGTTTPNGLIIVTTPIKNYHFSALDTGEFSQSIDLEPGLNIINITAVDSSDQETNIVLSLTYSTTKLE